MASILGFRSAISYFQYSSCLNIFYHVSRIDLSEQEKKLKIDFQDGGHGSHLGFLICMSLVISDLQIAPILPTKIRVI